MEGKNTSDSESQTFLKSLFSRTKRLIEIRAIRNGKARSYFFKSVDNISWDEFREFNKQGYNIYYGVGTRKEERGNKSAISEMVAIWVDVDAKHFKSKQEAWEHIQSTIATTGLTPAYIVDSGNGFHLYFLLKEPELVDSNDDIPRLEGYVKGMAKLFGGDHTHDLSRIMRLPGFDNVKAPSNPKPCEIIVSNPDQRYNLCDFEIYCVEGDQSNGDAIFEIGDVPKQIPQRFVELLKKRRKVV